MPYQNYANVGEYYQATSSYIPFTNTSIGAYNLTDGYNYLDFGQDPLNYPPNTLIGFNFGTGKVAIGDRISNYSDRRLNGAKVKTSSDLSFYVKAFAFTVNPISYSLSRAYTNYGPYPLSAVFQNREGNFLKAHTIINVIKRMYNKIIYFEIFLIFCLNVGIFFDRVRVDFVGKFFEDFLCFS